MKTWEGVSVRQTPRSADVIRGASVGLCTAEPATLCSWELPGLTGIIGNSVSNARELPSLEFLWSMTPWALHCPVSCLSRFLCSYWRLAFAAEGKKSHLDVFCVTVPSNPRVSNVCAEEEDQTWWSRCSFGHLGSTELSQPLEAS